MSHIAPVLPQDGDPGWGDVMNAAINQVVDTVNAHDDEITAIGAGTFPPSATTSTQGVIQLAGDLTGTASAPALVNTITPATIGSSSTTPVVTFDAKGRITAASSVAPLKVNTFGVAPRIGYVSMPAGYTYTTTGTPTSGKLYWYPYLVAVTHTVDAMYLDINAAQVGGSSTFQAALYADDGTGWPDGTARVIAPVTFGVNATGNISSTLSAPVVLAPGRYWMMVLFQIVSAPSSQPAVACLTTNTWALPVDTSTVVGTAVNGYELPGQTAFPVTAITSGYSPTASGSIPVIGLHRSA